MSQLILVLIVVVSMKYIVPILDVILELITYFISSITTKIIISSQKYQIEFQKEYGDMQDGDEIVQTNQIGFKMYDDEMYEEIYPDDEEYDEEYDDEVNKK